MIRYYKSIEPFGLRLKLWYKDYTNFRRLNVPNSGVGSESFTISFINYLLIYENKYQQ